MGNRLFGPTQVTAPRKSTRRKMVSSTRPGGTGRAGPCTSPSYGTRSSSCRSAVALTKISFLGVINWPSPNPTTTLTGHIGICFAVLIEAPGDYQKHVRCVCKVSSWQVAIRPQAKAHHGHIDFLQVRNGAIHILRFKSDARTSRVRGQVILVRTLKRQSPKNIYCLEPPEDFMLRDFGFLVLFFVLLSVWAVSWLAFHLAGGLIHLVLIVAVISLVLHLFRGARSA